jgi:hypothetical protein
MGCFKDQVSLKLKRGGRCVWISNCPGVGFKLRNFRREKVIVNISGPGKKIEYATFLEKLGKSEYVKKTRKSTAARSVAKDPKITAYLVPA